MSNLNIEFPDLDALISLIKNQIKREINCVSVGTIQEFNSTTQTANVFLNYRKTLKKRNSVSIKENADVIIKYPVLVRCPVVILGGGGSYLTFPIAAGDDCVVLFCDRDIDLWLEKGYKDNPPVSERMHSFSDAIALVGLRSVPNKISSYEASKVTIKYGNGTITIDELGNIAIQGTTITINGTIVSINPL